MLDHCKVGDKVEVKVLWSDDDHLWEPMEVVRKDSPIVLATYAEDKDLIYSPGSQWARKQLVKNKKGFACMLKLLKGQVKIAPRYKFGIQVP